MDDNQKHTESKTPPLGGGGLRIFFTALMFYTRIPVPKWTGYSKENLNKATGYFPLVGILVGTAGGAVYWLAQHYLPVSISVLLCMVTTILLTGAFHEDAISDFCDGFGGGYSKEQILTIMKDSRIGTYGAIGLVMTLLSRYFLLSNIDPLRFFAVIVAANALSRLNAVGLIFSSEYVRMDETSKSKPIGEKHEIGTLILAIIFGFLPLIFLPWQSVAAIVSVLLVALVLFRSYIHKILGGYTGDVLGAFQQISEILFYLVFLISIHFVE
jgi:adenosylcobinamide-GDP ribazoletransferase